MGHIFKLSFEHSNGYTVSFLVECHNLDSAIGVGEELSVKYGRLMNVSQVYLQPVKNKKYPRCNN